MAELYERVLAAIREHGLLRPGEPVLVAVSGGCDSMVLLDVLHRLAATERWRLGVAHFNHHLRGPASRADQALVERTAHQLGLPCRVGEGDVRAHARTRGLSLEMAARELRHAHLAAAARELGTEKIALGHHADDQVETLLLRLLRGSGSEGLAGMKWQAPSPADPTRWLIRPLLGEARTAVESYAAAAGVVYREDASNRRLEAARNVLRRHVVPVLRRLQPALAITVPRLMTVLGDEVDYLRSMAQQWLRRRSPPFDQLHPALQRWVLLLQLRARGVEAGWALIERLRTLPGRPETAPGNVRVWRAVEGTVNVETAGAPGFSGEEMRLVLHAPSGAVEFAGVQFSWRIRARQPGRPVRVRPRAGRECLDADCVGPCVVLRHWRPGDRFQPLGLAAPAKLQDLFTNAKVARAERHQRVVATGAEGGIFWVEGLRPGAAVGLTPATRRVLVWRWARVAAGAEARQRATVAPTRSAW